MRFEHALQTATGLGAGTPDAYLSCQKRQEIEHAKWRLWHGRWKGCLIKLAGIRRWTEGKSIGQIAGVEALRRHLDDLLAYLEANRSGLVNYGARRRRGEPISTAFVESAINEIISKRMIKKQQCGGTDGQCSLSSTSASLFSTARWRPHSGCPTRNSALQMTFN
jgi:hypothetical protein